MHFIVSSSAVGLTGFLHCASLDSFTVPVWIPSLYQLLPQVEIAIEGCSEFKSLSGEMLFYPACSHRQALQFIMPSGNRVANSCLPLPSRSVSGDALPTRSLAEDALPSRSLLGDALPFKLLTRDALPTRSLPENTLPSRSVLGDALPFKLLTRDTLPTRLLAGDALPSRSLSGDTLPFKLLTRDVLPTRSLAENTLPSRSVYIRRCSPIQIAN